MDRHHRIHGRRRRHLYARPPASVLQRTSPHGWSSRGKPPWVGSPGCPRKINLRFPRSLPAPEVPKPFRGLTLEDRHRTEPCAVYTQEERRLLCALFGVQEMHRSTHLTSTLHAEHTAAERARHRPPMNAEAYYVAKLFCIGSQQAKKILAQKNPSSVAKDMAQAI
ncbi:hypothetical protein MTO96_042292 [Rhipicephalus appendiculatus]